MVTDTVASPWLHRFAVLTTLSTLFLIFVGGLVTSTGSGLAVPDWPLSYGMLMPPMVGGIFYEHGHRMVATGVGVLMVVLAIWVARREPRRWVRWLAYGSLIAVCVQGVLGGLTVLFLLPLAVSVAHGCLAQTFLCLLVALSVATSRRWHDAGSRTGEPPDVSVRKLSLFTTAAIFVQLIIGAVMRHLAKDVVAHDPDASGIAIPDFPLSFGGVVPPLDKLMDVHVAVHFLHRIGAVVVGVGVVVTLLHLRRTRGDVQGVRLPAWLLGLGYASQVTLGAFVIWTGRSVIPTTFHVATGAAMLAVSMWLTLLVHRRYQPSVALRTAPAVA